MAGRPEARGGVQKRTHFCVMARGTSQRRWRDVLHSFGHRCDCGTWASVKVLGCTGTTVEAHGLQGLDVDFTGSHFEPLAFEDTSINGAY